MKNLKEFTAANKAAWDASAAAFEAGDDWQEMLAQVRTPGFSVLDETLTLLLQNIGSAGHRAVQIGCNNGRELLSLPSVGIIPALGIDQSEAFLAQARILADAAGSACRFRNADIYELPSDIPKGFDLGLITIGVLNWMPDLTRFFQIVAELLAEGAPLVIYETHPVLEMFDPDEADPFLPTRSYFDDEPIKMDETITYDGTPGVCGPVSYWFTHSLGAIVTACVQAGLNIERLSEHPHSNREVDYDIYAGHKAQIPMCYTLVVRKQKG